MIQPSLGPMDLLEWAYDSQIHPLLSEIRSCSRGGGGPVLDPPYMQILSPQCCLLQQRGLPRCHLHSTRALPLPFQPLFFFRSWLNIVCFYKQPFLPAFGPTRIQWPNSIIHSFDPSLSLSLFFLSWACPICRSLGNTMRISTDLSALLALLKVIDSESTGSLAGNSDVAS